MKPIKPKIFYIIIATILFFSNLALAKEDASSRFSRDSGPSRQQLSKSYAHYTKGLLYDNEGKTEEAIKEYLDALNITSAHPRYILR